jgi:hypothetical protein
MGGQLLGDPVEVKEDIVQMRLESLAQITHVPVVTQLANGLSSLVPDMLLGVQVWATRREVEHVPVWMGFNELADLAFVPGRSVQEQQNGPSGKPGQDMLQKMEGVLRIQLG